MTAQDTLTRPDAEAGAPLEWDAITYPRLPAWLWIAGLGAAGLTDAVTHSLPVAIGLPVVLLFAGHQALRMSMRERLHLREEDGDASTRS